MSFKKFLRNRKLHFVSVIVLIVVLFFATLSCKTTDKVEEDVISLNTYNSFVDQNFVIFNDFKSVTPNFNSGYYIFLRLYNPVYSKKSGGALIQKCINVIDKNKYQGSHLAIGFDLNDKFYGLTAYANPNFSLEECTNVASNDYMACCDPDKSIQTTFYYEVSKIEYEHTKAFVKKCVETGCLEYDVVRNIAIAVDVVHRLNASDKKTLHTFKKRAKRLKGEEGMIDFKKKNKFVCCSAIGLILDECVPSVRDYFREQDLDYEYMLPTDYTNIKGLTPLFTSTWSDYISVAGLVAKESPIFCYYFSAPESTPSSLSDEEPKVSTLPLEPEA